MQNIANVIREMEKLVIKISGGKNYSVDNEKNKNYVVMDCTDTKKIEWKSEFPYKPKPLGQLNVLTGRF